MKKITSLILTLILGLTLTGCLGGGNDNPPVDDPNLVTMNVDFMQHMAADISGATALGIRRGTQAKDAKRRNLSTTLSDDETEDTRTYLYKTEQSIGGSEVTYDDVNLLQVTFTKNTSVTEDIYDAEGNLIGSNTVVTQDQLPAQINKFYVNGNYTFIQLVPVITEDMVDGGLFSYFDTYSNQIVRVDYGSFIHEQLRPSDDNLTATYYSNYENKYVTEHYDQMNYHTDDLTKTFVLDNETGLIYPLEGISIRKIDNGVIHGHDGLLYDMRLNSATKELEFFTLFQNTTIKVTKSFKDRHGNVYVENDSVNVTDKANGLLFYKKSDDLDYLLTNSGDVICFETSGQWYERAVSSIKRLSDNFEKIDIGTDETYSFPKETKYTLSSRYSPFNVHLIESGYLYAYYSLDPNSISEAAFMRISLSDFVFHDTYYHGLVATGALALSHDKFLYYYNGNLYYGNVYGENAFYQTIIEIDPETGEKIKHETPNYEALTLLLEDYSMPTYDNGSTAWGPDYTKMVFKKIDLAGTEYYVIKLDADGIPTIIKQSEFIAGAQNIVSLQPINK